MSGECSARKQRAYDPDNLSIRAFKLDGLSDSDGENSTENSSRRSEEQNDRRQAMEDVRGQWNAFSQRIMDVQIGSSISHHWTSKPHKWIQYKRGGFWAASRSPIPEYVSDQNIYIE